MEVLEHIDPARLDYQDWVNVGMALKAEGYPCDAWDAWSRRDPARYHTGDCARKWNSFRGSFTPVTGGTIVQLAKDQGWSPSSGGHALRWDDEIGGGDLRIIDPSWLEGQEIQPPGQWDPAGELIRYLETLFEASETVGYVTESWRKEDKYLPTKGDYSRTAGQLIEQLSKCGGDIGAVLGDYNPEAGAWIRFNPLDGRGVKNENVTDYRYALVESDTMPIDRQNAVIRELELPVACLVHSGGKSLHAIVRIEAATYEEYRKRVDYLYDVLKRNGMTVDTQNKNPSRLSRMPGVTRKGNKQFLVDTNIGKESWAEWKEWIEAVNDDLPDTEALASVWDELPALSPPLIEGVLRQGHKMLLAGPSKAGKSFALIELAISIAEGRSWLGFPCAQGRVLYVNLELDRASCFHRFRDVYDALGLAPRCLGNIDIWNLRGRSAPMDKLAPKMIRRASKQNYLAIIIDPIYKVITGDENSADQMAAFCNQFDKVCTELGCAVIYCHHHSKGAQGSKRSMDRASGSGVFARDPDALLDMIELELTDDIRRQRKNNAVCALCGAALEQYDLSDKVGQDDLCSRKASLDACMDLLPTRAYTALLEEVEAADRREDAVTGWRIDGTLREFPKFPAINVWFEYPVHTADRSGILSDLDTDDGFTAKGSPFRQNFAKRKSPQQREQDRKCALETAFDACGIEGAVTVKALAEYMGVSDKTVRNRIREHGGFWIDGNEVGRKQDGKSR